MKISSFKILILSLTVLFVFCGQSAKAVDTKDTLEIGIFIESIYDLDFANYGTGINFWMWSLTEGDENGDGKIDAADSIAALDRINMIEISNAKDYTFSHQTATRVVSHGETIWWAEQFCKASVYEKWNFQNYPFDRQRLVLKFENAAYDTSQLIMTNEQDSLTFKKDINLMGWEISKSRIHDTIIKYDSDFGDPNGNGTSFYSRVNYIIQLKRIDAEGFYIKLCLGVFIAFLVAVIIFAISPSHIDSRFGLGIGALFAVAANKYVVDANIPQAATNCLVDKIHEITFIYILLALSASVITLVLHEKAKDKERKMFDAFAGLSLFISYVVIMILLWVNAHAKVPL